jgi:hypothetical protein
MVLASFSNPLGIRCIQYRRLPQGRPMISARLTMVKYRPSSAADQRGLSRHGGV